MVEMFPKKNFAFLAFVFFLFSFASLTRGLSFSATIYKNEYCGHCGPYLNELKNLFTQLGISFSEVSVVSDQNARVELALVTSAKRGRVIHLTLRASKPFAKKLKPAVFKLMKA